MSLEDGSFEEEVIETREVVEEGEEGGGLTIKHTTVTRVTTATLAAEGTHGTGSSTSTGERVASSTSTSSRRSRNSSTTSTGSAHTDEVVGAAHTKNNFAARMAKFEKPATEDHKPQGRKPLIRTGSSSNRVGGSLFAKFEKGADSSDGGGRKSSHTKKLDVTKFSKFDPVDGGSSKEEPASSGANRASPSSRRAKSFRVASVSVEKCAVCDKRVYPMEKCSPDGTVFHKTCFKCAECKKLLRPENYASVDGRTYCKPHYTQLFRLKGSYDLAAASSRAPTKPIAKPAHSLPVAAPPKDSSDSSSVVSHDSPRKYIAEDEIPSVEAIRSARSRFMGDKNGDAGQPPPSPTKSSYPLDFPADSADSGVSENQPVVRTDVVHASDVVPETFSLNRGGLRSLRDTFEKGNVTNPKEEEARPPHSIIQDFSGHQAAAAGQGEGAGQVSENQPVVREDVLRESSRAEEPERLFAGLGQLRASFEQGQVSNARPQRRPSLEDLRPPGSIEDFGSGQSEEGGGGGQVSENQPEERPDLVRETTPRAEPMAASAGLKSIKDLFESGRVSRAPEPASRRGLPQDFPAVRGKDLDQGHVSENTPVVNSDVVQSTIKREVPVAVRGTASSLKSRWERGEVHNVETRKPALERQPHSFVKAEPEDEEEEYQPEPDYDDVAVEEWQQPVPSQRPRPTPRARDQLPSLPDSESDPEEPYPGGVNGTRALPPHQEEEADPLHISEPEAPPLPKARLANGGGASNPPGQPSIDDLVDDFGYECPQNLSAKAGEEEDNPYEDLEGEEPYQGEEQYYEEVAFSDMPTPQVVGDLESFDN